MDRTHGLFLLANVQLGETWCVWGLDKNFPEIDRRCAGATSSGNLKGTHNILSAHVLRNSLRGMSSADQQQPTSGRNSL